MSRKTKRNQPVLQNCSQIRGKLYLRGRACARQTPGNPRQGETNKGVFAQRTMQQLTQCRQTSPTMQERSTHNRFFRKLKQLCSYRQKRFSPPDLHVELLELRPDAIAGLSQPPWSGYIMLLRNLECRVIVRPLKEEIPSRYIGIQSSYTGATIVSRQYLMQREVGVVKTTIEFEAIPASSQAADLTDLDNNYLSYEPICYKNKQLIIWPTTE